MSNIFALITIFPLIKPEKQVSGMAENVCIHFLVLISMGESAGEGGAGADPGVAVPPPPAHAGALPSSAAFACSLLFSHLPDKQEPWRCL